MMRQNKEIRQESSLLMWLVVLFVICLPLEGVFRKWLLNGIQQPLVFVRDPILLAIYAVYFRNLVSSGGKLKSWHIWCIALTLLSISLATLQSFNSSLPPLVFAFGLRSYIVYIPLAFIMGECLRRHEVSKIVDVILICAIPVGALVALQFLSPVSSPLNKGLDDLVTGRFIVAAGIVRPYGPFTFTLGQTYFALLSLACCIYGFEKRRDDRRGWPLLASALVSTLVMGSLSGSRTFFFGALLLIGFYLAASLLGKNTRVAAGRLFGIATIGLLVAAIMLVVFPSAYQSMSERQRNASAVEGSPLERTASILTSVNPALATAPPLGYGIGAGSNAASAARGISTSWIYGEYEWPRMVNELGPFAGVIAIVIRLLFTAWLFVRSFLYCLRTGDASGMPMCGLAVTLLISGQVVGQNQALSFCWLVAGLCIAMSNTDKPIIRIKNSVIGGRYQTAPGSPHHFAFPINSIRFRSR